MIDAETLTKLNKLSEMCENLRKTLDEHYLDTVEELDYIYAEIDDTLHNIKPNDDDEKKKANIVFTGEDTNKWIPVRERLPKEENKSYWICTDGGYQCECRWTNVNPFWTDLTTDWHWHHMDVPSYQKVVAWMPLPKPYKAEGSEEE